MRDTFLVQLNSPAGLTPALIASMSAVDSANLAWLKPLLQAKGWPTLASLDPDGVDAVFLLGQHADRDPAFQASMLPLLEAADREGQ